MEHLRDSSSNHKLCNVSDSRLLKLQCNLRYYPSLTYPTAFPFSKGSHHHFRRSSSNNRASANTFQFAIWSICKWIIPNQSVCLRWQHLDVKWMDRVVKRRHRKYPSLYSLFNFTACSMAWARSSHYFIWTMSLAFLQVYLSRGSSRNTKRSRHWWAH